MYMNLSKFPKIPNFSNNLNKVMVGVLKKNVDVKFGPPWDDGTPKYYMSFDIYKEFSPIQ